VHILVDGQQRCCRDGNRLCVLLRRGLVGVDGGCVFHVGGPGREGSLQGASVAHRPAGLRVKEYPASCRPANPGPVVVMVGEIPVGDVGDGCTEHAVGVGDEHPDGRRVARVGVVDGVLQHIARFRSPTIQVLDHLINGKRRRCRNGNTVGELRCVIIGVSRGCGDELPGQVAGDRHAGGRVAGPIGSRCVGGQIRAPLAEAGRIARCAGEELDAELSDWRAVQHTLDDRAWASADGGVGEHWKTRYRYSRIGGWCVGADGVWRFARR